MARKKTLHDLLENLAPGVQRAFLESISRITGSVQIKALEAAIKSGDINAVLRVLDLGAEFFAPLDRALTEAFQAGGDFAMAEFMAGAKAQGVQVTAFFDSRNYAAETWLKSRSSTLISEAVNSTKANIRAALADGAKAGEGPRSTALRIVGRLDRSTGVRTGGLIGLTQRQEMTVQNAVQELIDGDPAYFDRKLRNRTYDRMAAKAVRDGGMSPANARKIGATYRTRILKHRGDMIARTELIQSLNHAKHEGLDQLIAKGKVTEEQITRRWDSADDTSTRDSHEKMDGQKRKGREPFETGAGFLMMSPGDTSLGAPASEVIGCRCFEYIDIDWIAGLGPDD